MGWRGIQSGSSVPSEGREERERGDEGGVRSHRLVRWEERKRRELLRKLTASGTIFTVTEAQTTATGLRHLEEATAGLVRDHRSLASDFLDSANQGRELSS